MVRNNKLIQEKVLILILLILSCSNSIIVYQNFNSISSINDWGLETYQCLCGCLATISMCNTQQILKINQCNLNDYSLLIYKTFELNPHNAISLLFQFWRIDDWNNYQFYVYADYQIIHQATYSHSLSQNNLCEDNAVKDETFLISKTLEHSSPTVTIMFVAQRGVWGISNFELSIEQCPTGCNFCYNAKCYDYQLIIEQFVQKTITTVSNSEGWSYNNLVSISASYCIDYFFTYVSGTYLEKVIQLDNHQTISIQLKVIIRNSSPTEIKVKIDDNIVYKTQYNEGWTQYPSGLCQYISLNSILIMDYIHSSSSIKITVEGNSFVQLIGIRDFQLYINKNSNNKICMDNNINAFDGCFAFEYDCVEGCKNCIQGLCFDCQIGWEFRIIQLDCVPICGDQIITNLEECDDGNTIPYDGCHQCSYSCPLNCLQCRFGYCLQCDSQFRLSLNKKQCISICNNGLITPFKYFNNYNNIQQDECYNYNNSCQIECQFCNYNQCILCQEGWILMDNKCYQQCGDGKVALSSIEQCDDDNQIENDGCFQCQYECIPNCFYCIDNNNCFICNDYFQLEDNLCKPICGDGIVINGLEDCDDENNDPSDGCNQCQFQCSYGCITCEKENICSQCDNLSILDNKTMQCIQLQLEEQELNQEIIIQSNNISDQNLIQLCGDGIINSQNEQCDDGNNIPFDGCSNQCQIEKEWSCQNKLTHSECFILTSFTLTLQNNKNSIQYVSLSFTNKVRLKEYTTSFVDNIRYFIQNIPSQQYSIKVNEVISIDQFKLLYPIYEFEIQFYQSQVDQPILKVSINENLLDLNDFQLDTKSKSINLQIPRILTEFQIATAIKLYTCSFWMTIGLGSGSFILLILGDIGSFTEIFDILQYQNISYIQTINVDFPHNVVIYFESSEIVTIEPVLNALKITQFFDKLIGDNHINSVNKLYEYNLNADLLINIYGQITQLIICIIIYIFLNYFSKYIQNNCFTQSLLQTKQTQNNKQIEWIIIKSYFLLKKLSKIGSSFLNSKGILQIFYANSWDLIFKVLNYLVSNKKEEIRIIISNIISIICLIIVSVILITYFQRKNFMITLKDLRFQQLDALNLFKKLIFLVILICIQNQPIFQCVMLTSLILCYIGLIKLIKFTSSNDVNFIIWFEAPVMAFTFISLAYCHELQKYLTTDIYFLLGFIQIGILIFGLLGPLIKFGIQFYHNAKKLFRQNKPIEQVQQLKIFTQT